MRGEVEEIRPKEDGESLIEYYLSESDNSNAASGTKRAYEGAWKAYKDWIKKEDLELGEIRKEHIEDFKEYLLSELNGGAPRLYFCQVRAIIEFLTETDEATHNPLNKVEEPEGKEDTSKIEVSLDQLRDAVLNAKSESITLFVYLVIALKTGLRSSEIVNLDLRDIHLNHPISKAMPDPRTEIYNHPDSLYVDSSISEYQIHNGEKREDGNKKKSSRKVPIDQELKSVLVWWIAMLPPSESPANPLLRATRSTDGHRYKANTMSNKVTRWARKNDLNSINMKHFGVDSHWCRHWFSTTLRANVDDDEVTIGSAKGYVEGLRGDSADSTIDTYTHEWDQLRDEDDKNYREVYEDNIPKLFIDPNED